MSKPRPGSGGQSAYDPKRGKPTGPKPPSQSEPPNPPPPKGRKAAS